MLGFKHSATRPTIINNDEWLSECRLIDFLRDVGRYFRVGVMLGKESVRARLNSETGKLDWSGYCQVRGLEHF